MCAPKLNYVPMPEARREVRANRALEKYEKGEELTFEEKELLQNSTSSVFLERLARKMAMKQDDFNKGFGKTKFEDTRDDSIDFVIGATTGIPMPSVAGMMGAAAHNAFTSVEDSDKSYTPSDSSNSSYTSSDYGSSSSYDSGSCNSSSSGGFGD